MRRKRRVRRSARRFLSTAGFFGSKAFHMRQMLDDQQLERLREQVKARNQIADERRFKLHRADHGYDFGRLFGVRARRAANAP
jgi:hypothetical protein